MDATTSGATGRSRLPRALAAVLTVAFAGATAGCSDADHTSSAQVFPAVQGVDQAEHLVSSIAGKVSPGATVQDSTARAGPDQCRPPYQGEVYYTIFKEFAAPTGEVGSDVKDTVTAALQDAGFTVRDTGESGGWPTLTGTASYIGLRALLSPDTPEVRLVVDTACGAP